jgi:hypothetical protein
VEDCNDEVHETNQTAVLDSEGHVIVLFTFLFKKNFQKKIFNAPFKYLDTSMTRCYEKFSYAA